MPDGFLNAPTSLATGAIAAAGVALALRRARVELDERTAPLAGLTAAFVFAAQMVNFPVGVGTSGHFIGGSLAAVLVGPWTAVLCLSVVLLIQALLFADGGLTALGTNVTLLGVVAVVAGWFVTKAVLAILPRRPASVVPAAALGALVSVPAAALVFVALFAAGGEASLSLGTLTATMVGWHVLIGIGEAVITGLTVSAIVAVRPDLVYAARGLRPALQLRKADGSLAGVEPDFNTLAGSKIDYRRRQGIEVGGAREDLVRPAVSRRALLAGGGLVALLTAGVASFFASGHPDGLEYVAGDQGFEESATDHAFSSLAFADYGEVGGIPVGLAGVLGVAVTVLLGAAVFRVVRGRNRRAHLNGDREGATT